MAANAVMVKWTPFALACLDEIYEYISFTEKSEDQALKLINAIIDRVDQLVSFPESGQLEPLLAEIGQSSRYLLIASYKIIYEYHPVSEMILITDVFHTSQNPGKVARSTK